MKTIERDFIELTKRAINLQYEDDGFFCETDWKTVFDLAAKNKLAGVIFKVASKQASLPEDIKKAYDHYKFQIFVRQKNHYHILRSILDDFDGAGIKYACFKGSILAELYPEPATRVSCDSDILINECFMEKARGIILSKGYEILPDKSKDKVPVFYNNKTDHTIELHTSLYEDYEGQKIALLEDGHFDDSEKFIQLPVEGQPMWTLDLNEHLVYQIFHIVKHFMLEGANIRFFTDITLYINKYIDQLDADIFWLWMDKLNYNFFAENFLQICIDSFGMKREFMQGRAGRASKEVLEAMVTDFIYQGNEDNLRQSSWQLTATLAPYLVGELTSIKKDENARKIRYLFPSSDELGDRYIYAKKHKALLPAAWIHRICHSIYWQLFEREEDQYSNAQKAFVVQNRLGLMGSVGLLDEE